MYSLVKNEHLELVIIPLILCKKNCQNYGYPSLLLLCMHLSVVTTASPPTGKGKDYDFSVFNALL